MTYSFAKIRKQFKKIIPSHIKLFPPHHPSAEQKEIFQIIVDLLIEDEIDFDQIKSFGYDILTLPEGFETRYIITYNRFTKVCIEYIVDDVCVKLGCPKCFYAGYTTFKGRKTLTLDFGDPATIADVKTVVSSLEELGYACIYNPDYKVDLYLLMIGALRVLIPL
jgi:hypothetical protein